MSVQIEKQFTFHFIIDVPINNDETEFKINFSPNLHFNIEKRKIDNIFGIENNDLNIYHFIAITKEEIKNKEYLTLSFYYNKEKYESNYLIIDKNVKSKFFFEVSFTKYYKNWFGYTSSVQYKKLNKYQEYKIYMEYC